MSSGEKEGEDGRKECSGRIRNEGEYVKYRCCIVCDGVLMSVMATKKISL